MTVLRRAWRICKWLLLLLLCAAGAVLLINAIDEPLSQEAAALAQDRGPPLTRQQNMYYAAMGFNAAAPDLEEAGWNRLQQLPASITGDSKLLYQAFSNLLSNAMKYSANGSPIQVDARAEAGQVLITVQDQGIGIPAQDLEHLFERYHRGSNVKGIVGTGIGLYLVRMVVALHGGEVAVESREGQGSRFTVRLPAGARMPA